MAEISREDVLRLASLSSIELSDSEVDGLSLDLKNIVDYINQLQELDTSGVEPTYQVTDLENVWRKDEIIDYKVSREQLLDLAPEQSNNSIKVPKVL